MRLRDKVAIITGSGSGQGRVASLIFAKEGAKVVVTDWNKQGGDETVDMVRRERGEAIFVQADVSSSLDVQNLIKTAVDTYGKLDILYNNAAVGYSSRYFMGSVVDTPEEDWDAVIRINLGGVFLCCKYGIPALIKNGGGSIINISSINALVAMLGADSYTAAKGGVVALTRAMAIQYAQHNIRVNCICPGGVDTPMIRRPTSAAAPSTPRPPAPQPPFRIANPEEIAFMALFLASDEASYVNGTVIPVDGGYTAR